MKRDIFKTLRGLEQGAYVAFEMIELEDDCRDMPDDNDEGFWGPVRAKSPGFIGEDKTGGDLVKATADAQARYDAFASGELGYIGIRAKATIYVKHNPGMITDYTIESAGVWGVESDAHASYKQDLFENECEELRNVFKFMSSVRYIQ